MNKNYIKGSLNALLIIACVFFQSCKDQDTITPQSDEVVANNDVLQKIKSLGFADSQIKEMPSYYLADGDLYFSKKISGNATTPGKKTKHRVLEKYNTLTIHLDESLAGVIDENWRIGINQAITEWNGNEKAHFHFEFTNSTAANINIVNDIDLPKDLAIASEFPKDGRTGSKIHVNVNTTKAVEDPKQAFVHALEHCVGFLHSTSLKNKNVKINNNAIKTARGPRFNLELYAIQGDILYRIDAQTGEYYAVDDGWAGTEVMGQIGGWLYMVQFGTLWVVSPSTGAWTGLTDGWGGSQYITSIPAFAVPPAGKLYIMQDSWIWPVDPDTGLWDGDLGSFTLARGLNGFVDAYDFDKYKLAVLKRKSGSSTVSILYVIDPSSGAVLSSKTVPASGVAGWNKSFLLTSTPVRIEVFNGTINFEDALGGHFTQGNWPDAEVVTSYGHTLYVINKGTLYSVKLGGGLPDAVDGVHNAKRLGKLNAWIDTSCMVVLQ